MGLAKVQYFFRAMASKAVNYAYIAKAAVRIEQILRGENIEPRKCFFEVEGTEDSPNIKFILQERKLFAKALAKMEVPRQAATNFALLGHALAACGVLLSERIWITGFGAKHLEKNEPLRKKVYEIRFLVAELRKKYNIIAR